MRTIDTHKSNWLNERLQVLAVDEPGSGGANHLYEIEYTNRLIERSERRTTIKFQNGPIKEAGVNGITNEALLAILIDRMQGFQRGKFSSRENAVVLTKLEEAMMWLQKRTRDRVARGVEGTHQE